MTDIKSTDTTPKKGPEKDTKTTKTSPFPPLSTSLPSFLEQDSDANFRKLIYNVLTVSALMLKIRERYASYIDVSGPQYSILVAIAETEHVTVSQLAQQLHVSPSFITAEVGKLHKQGYIKRNRNTEDRRSAVLSLSKTGKELILRLAEYRRLGNDLTFGSFSTEQAQIFSAHMEQLVEDAQQALHALDAPHWKNE